MNCKPGDLAIVVSAFNPVNLGRILHISSFAGEVSGWGGTDRWHFDGAAPLIGVKGSCSYTVKDSCIRPIRDNPDQDETLTWLDVPSTDKVTA